MVHLIESGVLQDRTMLTGPDEKSLNEKQTVTLNRPQGPLVVDVWPARTPGAVTPVLLIHGWGGTGSYWQSTARSLSQTARVYVPDLPGTGRSQPVWPAQDMFAQVASLNSMLDAFGLDKVQVVGHSMGAAMAVLLADLAPERVERLALTSMCFFLNKQQMELYTSIMSFIQLGMRVRYEWMASLPGLPQMIATRYFYRIPRDKALLRQGFLDYLQLDFDTAVACANNATDPRIEAAGAQIKVPTILIPCRQDQVMPLENVEYSAQRIPDCQVRWIDQCGHLPMVEKPAQYMAILHNFLKL
ncbi:MAG: alpha/beta hydrolase [Anaerolineales bacterium]|nr:alpha/beta hydrolase [Anaerolineales bacterium]